MMYQSMPVDPVLRIRNLSKRFGAIAAVDNLSLDVGRKDVYGFLGPNGSGKSTTIRMLLTLLKPDQGQIEVFGLPLLKKRKAILKNVGAFIEKPDFYEYLTAKKNLEVLSIYSGINPDMKNIGQILELVGLNERAASKVSTFSKGMKQRLGIAQALLNDPDLLILDEPASGLDPSGNRDIRELIRYLNRERGKTIILSSHNLSEIELIANRMVIINKGKKVVEGEVRSLLLEQNYLTNFLVDNGDLGIKLLLESTLEINSPRQVDNLIQVECTKQMIPEINAYLVSNGIRVESIKVEQNLEDYFLKLI